MTQTYITLDINIPLIITHTWRHGIRHFFTLDGQWPTLQWRLALFVDPYKSCDQAYKFRIPEGSVEKKTI